MNNFILAEFGGKTDIHDQIRILDAIYKNTGIIREIQVSKKLSDRFRIKSDKSLDELFDYLDNRIAETKSVLAEQVRNFDIDGIKRFESKMYLILKEANEKRMFAKAVKFIKKRVKKSEFQVFERSDNERYHKIRSNIKEIYFFFQLLFSKDDCRKKNFDLKPLKKLGTKLGKWHDVEIFLEYIHSFAVEKYASDKLEVHSKYNKLISHLKVRQKKELKKIDHEIIITNNGLLEYLKSLRSK